MIVQHEHYCCWLTQQLKGYSIIRAIIDYNGIDKARR